MKKAIKYLASAVLLSYGSYGQDVQMKQGNKDYEKCAYVDAVKIYEKVFNRGYKSADMLKKLGNAYYFQADYANASKWYAELFLMPEAKEAEYYYRYAQSLKANMDYAKADELLSTFYKMDKQDKRALMAQEQKNYLDIIKKNSGRYTIANAGINSDKSDYGSAFLGKNIVFASALGKNEVNDWTGENCTDLYISELKNDGSLGKPSKFGNALNTKYNESTPVFTKDGQTVYFTRNNYMDGKKGMDQKKMVLLKLYKATKSGNKWINIKELPFNSNEYSVAHPALSPDEKTLYFVSNMPGTLGQSDIYKVSINGNDSYGNPVNLGSGINTEGRETFPFISAKNELYFASDGYPGLGGLDIFVAQSKGEGKFGKPQNVGEPINGPSDDFAFLIDTDSKHGFFSSNRDKGLGSDDIYKLTEDKELINAVDQKIKGKVKDEKTGELIAGADVVLSDSNQKLIKAVKTDAAGNYDFGVLESGTIYTVRTEKKDYSTAEKTITTGSEKEMDEVDLAIKPENVVIAGTQKVTIGDNIAVALGIEMIHFNVNKSDIRSDAEVEMFKILAVLEQYPKVHLDIRSHTDCRNTKAYNLVLSERRVKSTIAWLVKHGITRDRLTGRGYGESQLLNNCECEGPIKSICTDEEHQKNRRSEFIITKI